MNNANENMIFAQNEIWKEKHTFNSFEFSNVYLLIVIIWKRDGSDIENLLAPNYTKFAEKCVWNEDFWNR